jgi:hypothetical protein
MEALDLGSSTDELERSVGEFAKREKAISAERRLLHQYLDLLGVERSVQTSGVPLDGWIGKLAARENQLSYERSLVQGRLDIMRAVRKERRAGRSSLSLGAESLVRALSRHGGRSLAPAPLPDSPPSSP